MNKVYLYFVALVLVFSTIIKIQAVKNYNFPFTTDQGRDMVDIRQMVVSHTPRLVGPTTSINGVLLGPFWYYFLLPPFIMSGGNPQVVMYWQILWYQLSAIILWHVLKRKDNLFACILATFYLLMPMGFNTGRYFWNANAMPIFAGIFFATLFYVTDKISNPKLLILGFISGLSMQIEAAFGILFFPFAFLVLLYKKRRFKELLYLSAGFLITLLPQIAFELRHKFIMTKILMSEFTGKGEMLGTKITFAERFAQRSDHFLSLIHFTSHLPTNWTYQLFILGLLIIIVSLLFKKVSPKFQNVYLYPISFIAFSGIFYLLFPQSLKSWYTLGLCVSFVFILSIAVHYLISSKNTIICLFGLFLFLATCYYASKSQLDYVINNTNIISNDRSNLKNELADIDWVYKNAEGKGFNAYSYLPSVYDFPYHYLYWWYGTKQYGYQPADVAYLPQMPEYIKNNNLIWTKTKTQNPNGLTFLIIEKDLDMASRETAWLGNFSKMCRTKESSFPWTAKVVMLSSCTK